MRIHALLVLFLCACGGETGNSEPLTSTPIGPADNPNPGPSTPGKTCGEQAFTMKRAVPDVLIVLDRSGSMSEGGSPTLWETSRIAINEITAAMDRQIWFGLYVFPSGSSPYVCGDFQEGCQASASMLVPIGDAKAGAIKAALAPMQGCGWGTPTAAALAKAKLQLQALPQNGHARAILLVTDGGPNCNAGLNPKTCTCTAQGWCEDSLDCLDDGATFKQLDGLCAAGIKTYVLGLGGALSMTGVLAGMAQHGCTSTPHAASDAASVKNALQQITGGIASCSFEIDCTKIQDLYLVNFYLDGKVIPRTVARTGGWDWTTQCKPGTGKGAIELFGAECAALKGQTAKTISAKYGCATQID